MESFTRFLYLDVIHVAYANISWVKANHMIATDSKGICVLKERSPEEKSWYSLIRSPMAHEILIFLNMVICPLVLYHP